MWLRERAGTKQPLPAVRAFLALLPGGPIGRVDNRRLPSQRSQFELSSKRESAARQDAPARGNQRGRISTANRTHAIADFLTPTGGRAILI